MLLMSYRGVTIIQKDTQTLVYMMVKNDVSDRYFRISVALSIVYVA